MIYESLADSSGSSMELSVEAQLGKIGKLIP